MYRNINELSIVKGTGRLLEPGGMNDGTVKRDAHVDSHDKGMQDEAMIYMCNICHHRWTPSKNRVRQSGGNPLQKPKVCPKCRSALWNREDMVKNKCRRCGHEWVAVSDSVYKCPKCLSARWRVPPEYCRCKICGYVWEKKTKATPKACPSCKRYDWDARAVPHICRKCGKTYMVKPNTRGKCPSCGIQSYCCVCPTCGYIWSGPSGICPDYCINCESPLQRSGGRVKPEKSRILKGDVGRTVLPDKCDPADLEMLAGIHGVSIEDAEIRSLISNGWSPIEVTLITGKSYDHVMTVTRKEMQRRDRGGRA